MKRLLLYLIPLVLLSACSGSQKLSNQNLSFLYQRNTFHIDESYTVFNINDSVSSLYYRINTEHLLFKKTEGSIGYTAEVEITYKIYNYESRKELLTHGTISIDNIENKNYPFDITGKIELKIPTGNSFLLEIITTDFHRNNAQKSFLKIDKTGINSRQNFLVKDSKNEFPLLKNHVKENEQFTIQHADSSIKTLFVRFYQRNFPVAALPFSTESKKPFQYEADSSFSINLAENSVKLSFSKKGFYHFQADTNNRNGFTLFIFDENFPNIKAPQDLLFPLIYITNRDEFANLTSAPNTKEAVDKFWLDVAGNPDRAKELISKYYNRVKEANAYFTSYLEGWKTDRGIIYIIFGPPNIVYKYANSEIWIYGEENNLMSLNFSFFKTENPFTDNDFTLDKSPVYRTNWYQAVDVWRQGRVN